MRFLRYPGGKSRILSFLLKYFPNSKQIQGTYIEPFVGGGSVFFHFQPIKAILADLNQELILLYKGLKQNPKKVWETFVSFPSGRETYYQIRNQKHLHKKPIYYQAARILYLNRTCFKGLWRHNKEGTFNVGYGGEERRKVLRQEILEQISYLLKRTKLYNQDFESTIQMASDGDFLFLDPPYKPGAKELLEVHYWNGKFLFSEQERLANVLKEVSQKKRIRWAMTNSAHKEILKLYKNFRIQKIPIGVSNRPGILTRNSQEVLITNY